MSEYSKHASKVLPLFILLSFLDGKSFFIDISGISLRPIYFLVPFMLYSTGKKYTKAEINHHLIFPFIYYLILLLGLLPIIFSSTTVNIIFIKNVVFMIVQLSLYFTIGCIILKCEKKVLFRAMENVLPFITIPPLLVFLWNGPSHFGLIGTKYLGVFLGHDGLPRLTGFFDDPNYFGLSMWGLIFIVVLMSQTYKFRKLTFVYLFIGVVDIVLTLSRMALLTGVLFIFLSVLSNKKNIRYLAMLIPLVIFVFFVPLSNSDIQDLILSRFSGNNDGSLDERTILLRTGLKSFYLHPFGVGIGNQQDYYLIEYGQAKLSHNDWISVMIECGILGVISYMMIFIVLFVLSKNKLSKICIICFVFILCTLTSYTYLAIIPIFVIFISYLSYILPKRERYAPSI